jgi:hypothetical protein
MTPTRASYRDSCVSARIKTGVFEAASCPFPRRNALRRTVIAWMVQVHRISEDLADFHVSQMDFAELRRRVRHYLGVGVGVGVGSRAPEPSPAKSPTRETVNQRIQPRRAIAVRSPSGGGGGGLLIFPALKTGRRGRGALDFDVFT